MLLGIAAGAQAKTTYYGIKVGGVEVNSDNYTNVTGKNITAYKSNVNGGKPSVSFSPTTGTLTLYNVKIDRTGKDNRAILNENYQNLTVVLKGENYLKAEDAAPLRFEINTSIKSAAADGKTRSQIYGGSEDAIYTTGSKTVLTIYDADLWIESNSSVFDTKDHCALVIRNSYVMARNMKSKYQDCYALYDYSSLVIENSNVYFEVEATGPTVKNLGSFSMGNGMYMSAWKDPGPGHTYDLRFDSKEKNFYYGTSTTNVVKLQLHFLKGLAINAANFPDAIFRNYLLAQTYGKDGYLTPTELDKVTEIDVSKKGISSLKGVENFTKLTKLVCNDNNLQELNVSTMADLENLDCSHNKLTKLDLTKNTNLLALQCNHNQLSALNLEKNTKLVTLYCYHLPELSSLDVKNCPNLWRVSINEDSKLRFVDLSNNKKLQRIEIHGSGIDRTQWERFAFHLPIVDRQELYVWLKGLSTGLDRELINLKPSEVKMATKNGWYVMINQGNGWERFGGKKLPTTVKAPKPAEGLVYNGETHQLFTPGNAYDGEMQYSVDGKNYSANSAFGARDAGIYTVYYKVIGDEDYEDVAPQSITVTISQAKPVVTAPQAITGLTANGTAQPLITAGKTTGGELRYSLDGLTWSTAIPTATDAGDYTVYYKVEPDANYIGTAAQTLKVSIAKAGNTGLKFSAPVVEVKAGEAFTAPKLENPNGLPVSYSSSDTSVATVDSKTGAVTIVGAGTAVITAKFEGNSTYDAATVSYTITVAKKVPTVTAPVAATGLKADGTAQPLIAAGSTTGGEMQYSLDGVTWSTAVPTATAAGTYTVYYKVVGDKQYEDVAAKSVTVTVEEPATAIREVIGKAAAGTWYTTGGRKLSKRPTKKGVYVVVSGGKSHKVTVK